MATLCARLRARITPVATSVAKRIIPVREISLVLLAAATIFLSLAIISYSPEDPGFSFSGQGGEIHNLVGTSGAYFADLVLYLLGWVAFIIPVALILVGVRLIFSSKREPNSLYNPAITLAGSTQR